MSVLLLNLRAAKSHSIESGKIILQTKDGVIDVVISEKTAFKKVSPENPKIATATDSNLTEIGVGDKILVTGEVAADKKNISAKTVYLMSKSAIAEKQQKESEQWKTRGISGRVTNLNFEKNEITIAVKNMTGETNVVITPKESYKILRYAPNSIKYSEAKPSNLKEIYIGDVVRALGDKSEDGATFKAEEVISGAFQTVGGKVKSIDAANNADRYRRHQNQKRYYGFSQRCFDFQKISRRYGAENGAVSGDAGRRRQGGFRPPQGTQTNNQANPPNGENRTPGQGGMGGGRGGMRGGDINEMFERLPVITIADLKVGDLIAVSSTKTDNPAKITAIRLLAGIEPFLTTPQMANGNGRDAADRDANFSIPGLDGFAVP